MKEEYGEEEEIKRIMRNGFNRKQAKYIRMMEFHIEQVV